jgi:hypothetical protein
MAHLRRVLLVHLLYTLHGVSFGTRLPRVYALMTDKSNDLFVKLFQKIKEFVVFEPKYMVIDFEIAAKEALNKTFTSTHICGCHFHFAQSIWKNIQKHNL